MSRDCSLRKLFLTSYSRSSLIKQAVRDHTNEKNPPDDDKSEEPDLTARPPLCLTSRMDKVEQSAIRDTLRGNPDCFRALVDRHYAAIFRVAFRITGHAQDAEEVAQEAFLRAYHNLAAFQQNSTFSTWIHRIAMNTALNFVERRTRDRSLIADSFSNDSLASQVRLEPVDQHAGPEHLLLDREAHTLREAGMAELTPMERAAFTLRHLEGLPIPDIAAALHVPANSAKQAVFRAVTKLRRSLAPLAGGLR